MIEESTVGSSKEESASATEAQENSKNDLKASPEPVPVTNDSDEDSDDSDSSKKKKKGKGRRKKKKEKVIIIHNKKSEQKPAGAEELAEIKEAERLGIELQDLRLYNELSVKGSEMIKFTHRCKTHPRFFTISDNCFVWRKSKNAKKMRGSIALPEITGFVQGPKSEVLVKHMDNKKNRADEDLRKYFAIVTKQRTISIEAASPQEATLWLSALSALSGFLVRNRKANGSGTGPGKRSGRFVCTYPGCNSVFSTSNDLSKHFSSHSKLSATDFILIGPPCSDVDL